MQIAGKKAAFKVLQTDETMWEDFKSTNTFAGETDLAFNSRILKTMAILPFETEGKISPVKKSTKSASPPAQSPAVKTILKDAGPKKVMASKVSLSKLISRRRLEGGEFTYVYIPLEKPVAGKKAMYNFLKNQGEEFSKLKASCKLSSESEEEFDSRMMKEMLTVPYEKDIVETEMVTEDENNSSTSKRKIKGGITTDTKKAKTDGVTFGPSVKNVFVEVDIFKSHEVLSGLIQIGAIDDTEKKFFRAIKSKTMQKFPDTVLSKMGLGRTNNSGILVYKKFNKTEQPCVLERHALDGLLEFFKTVKGNHDTLALYTYRKESFTCLLNAVNFHGLRKQFDQLVGQMGTMEEIFKERKIWAYCPLKSLSVLYSKTMGISVQNKKPSCEDLAEYLLKSSNFLTVKHSFSLGDCTRDVEFYFNLMENSTSEPLQEGTFSVTNSASFVRNEKFRDDGSASTSKAGSKSPAQQKKAGKETEVTRIAEEAEVMEIEEDNFEFSTVCNEVVYPVLCQPVLVKLGTMDENTKFIKFNPSKQIMSRAKANQWEILKDSSKVFWKNDNPYAFCNLLPIHNIVSNYKSGKVGMVDTITANTVIGEYKSLNKTDEEQRNLSTKVTVDIVVAKAGMDPSKIAVSKEPTAILVKLVLKEGSLTSGELEDFEFRPSDVLICRNSNVKGVTFVNKFISVDKKQAVANRAKVIIKSNNARTLLEGLSLGTATLFQNDVKLVLQTVEQQAENTSELELEPSVAIMQVKHKQKRPLLTMGASRLYAKGVNPVLVRLDQYESTRLTPQFTKAFIQFSDEFNNIIDANSKVLKIEKMNEKESMVKVFWRKNVPYAFVNICIKPPTKPTSVDFCDIVKDYEIGSYAPLEFGNVEKLSKVSMHLCVDFAEKNCMVGTTTKLITCYLKFKDAEIDKKDVLEHYFAISKVHHKKIEILNVVIKPEPNSQLAPQKTATNDMKVVLLVRARSQEDPAILNAREVLADCDSLEAESNLEQ